MSDLFTLARECAPWFVALLCIWVVLAAAEAR